MGQEQNNPLTGRLARWGLGIDPNSPLGKLSQWNPVTAGADTLKNTWQTLSQAPPPVQEPTLMPSHGGPTSAAPVTPKAPIEGLKGVGITDGEKMGGSSYVMDPKDSNVSQGWMSKTPDGAGLNGNEWAAQHQGSSYQAPPRISTEELYQQAFRNPNSVAPGANQASAHQLEDRVGTEDFARLLGQKQDETIASAQTELDPRVQEAAEQEAIRGTYPAREAGKASGFAAMLGLQGDQIQAGAEVEAARARRDALGSQVAGRAIQELAIAPANETGEDRAQRLQYLQKFQEMERGISTGEYFLSDYLDQFMDESAQDSFFKALMGDDDMNPSILGQ